HAGATRLIVRIDFRSQSLALRISDDGCGFEPDTQDLIRSGHLGLLGMHERARLLEGGLEVASAPNSGTIVSALFPISSGSAECLRPSAIGPAESIRLPETKQGIRSPPLHSWVAKLVHSPDPRTESRQEDPSWQFIRTDSIRLTIRCRRPLSPVMRWL
ncbi:MAG: hypothetical protein M1557_02540, partial [Actinobacteria bacterium]|nr:hypothetical protein [Actinomycetota bacterium]